MVEQGTHKPLVVGSNPALATTRKPLTGKGIVHSMLSTLLAGEGEASPAFLNQFAMGVLGVRRKRRIESR
jgi:hypothetical protein